MEWSSFCIIFCTWGVRVKRWYEAEVAYNAKSEATYIEVATRAMALCAASMSNVPAGMAIKAAMPCIRPRQSGRHFPL